MPENYVPTEAEVESIREEYQKMKWEIGWLQRQIFQHESEISVLMTNLLQVAQAIAESENRKKEVE